MIELPYSATTPISIGRVGLRARDADALANWYKGVLGLTETGRSGNTIKLSAESRPLLEIEGSATLQPDDPRSAGLYHTAFLLPRRSDLAKWTQHAIDQRIPVDGASDHLVSEAIYLTDPEGNGVEIYADRPKDTWPMENGVLRMGTDALDFRNLMTELTNAPGPWRGAPEGSVVGHVHLRVGDAKAANEWWNNEFGLDTVLRYGAQAVFLSSGGYHHHIGANSWQSSGAGSRKADRSGLSWVELLARGETSERSANDPWGSEIRLTPA